MKYNTIGCYRVNINRWYVVEHAGNRKINYLFFAALFTGD